MIQILQTVGLFDAKNRLAEICGSVAETGSPVVIAKRGEPLVEVRPLGAGEEAGDRSVPDSSPSPESRQEAIAGILDALHDCENRFGSLEQDFDVPAWKS